MIFLGIDPGLKGALAWIRDSGETGWVPMPVVKGSKGKPEYDVLGLLTVLKRIETGAFVYAVSERLQPLPPAMGGSQANYARGRALGLLEGVLVACSIPYQLVRPMDWQKVMLAGTSGSDTKQRSIIACHRLFPMVDLLATPRCRKPHDGAADALLLADFARRTYSAQ